MSAVPASSPRRSPGVGSLANKLALLFAGVVLLGVAVVYFFIVPQLRSNLEQQVIEELTAEALMSAGPIEDAMNTGQGGPVVDTRVRRAAEDAGARVSLLGLQSSPEGPGSFYTISDSNVDTPTRLDFPTVQPTPEITVGVAGSAVEDQTLATGLGRSSDELVAQTAVPLAASAETSPEWVAVYSQPLEDVDEAVGLIERQLLVAGLLAVLIALAGGWLVARAVARRVRRLEAAANEVAEGRSVQPLPIDAEDELGQLTRTFNEMQDKLARLDRSRRDFIANASHELRTPIFSLGGFAELLADEDLDPETRERFLASMREQVDRLKRLAADLLDLSRLDAGALEIHSREADVREVAEAVAREFAPVVVERDVKLAIDLPDDGLPAYCDPDRLAQIVRILLDNALRHTPPGTPVVLSGARRDGVVELTVSDAGPGLEPGEAERVFDRFYTADPGRGSGLGLAIACELARAMDGGIDVRSSADGTAFTVALPAGAEGTRPSNAAGEPTSEAPLERVPAGRS